MAIQRTLDEYLKRAGTVKSAGHAARETVAEARRLRALTMCLKPSPRPRTVIVCDSLKTTRADWADGSSGYTELDVESVAEMLCKRVYPDAETVVLEVSDDHLIDPLKRLLVFWTIRSMPQKFRIVLVLPELFKIIEEAGGEKALPLKPPESWSWLVTLVLRKIGGCWEAVV